MSDKQALNFSPNDESSAAYSRPQQVGISSFQALSILMAILVTAAVAFLAGVLYERSQGLASSEEFVVFWEAWDRIEDDYYFTDRLPNDQQRVYGAIQGFVTTLGDPNTRFAPPTIAEDSREQIEGRFGGIGAVVGTNDNNEPYIIEVIADECINTTPADAAGLRSNDVIRAVDGASVEGLDLNGVVDLVRGRQGTIVTLTVFRPEAEETLDIDVRRDNIENITVNAEMIDDIGYMHLTLFNAVATKQLRCKLELLMEQNPRAIILDLHDNPGGLLNEALLVADVFLEEGLVLTQRDREGNVEQLFSDSGDEGEDIPLYVIVDDRSASASEVVAGALRDRDRAVLIGQTTFGKGSVQNVYELSDGSELRVTSAAWYTPDDVRIEGQGLAPDEFVDCEGLDPVECDARNLSFTLEFIEQDLPATSGETAALPPN
jgi:carboxyl-terminal processing protease